MNFGDKIKSKNGGVLKFWSKIGFEETVLLSLFVIFDFFGKMGEIRLISALRSKKKVPLKNPRPNALPPKNFKPLPPLFQKLHPPQVYPSQKFSPFYRFL